MAETKAQQIAHLLHNDACTWRTDTGQTMDDLVARASATEERRGNDGWTVKRFRFADGSALLVTPEWWDLEAPGRPWVCAGAPGEGELGA